MPSLGAVLNEDPIEANETIVNLRARVATLQAENERLRVTFADTLNVVAAGGPVHVTLFNHAVEQGERIATLTEYLREAREAYKFVPDENGGHILAGTHKWYPENFLRESHWAQVVRAEMAENECANLRSELSRLREAVEGTDAERERLARTEAAIEWCRNRGIVVKFFWVHNVPRVEARVFGGFPQAEAYTFVEAAEACMASESLTPSNATTEEA